MTKFSRALVCFSLSSFCVTFSMDIYDSQLSYVTQRVGAQILEQQQKSQTVLFQFVIRKQISVLLLWIALKP